MFPQATIETVSRESQVRNALHYAWDHGHIRIYLAPPLSRIQNTGPSVPPGNVYNSRNSDDVSECQIMPISVPSKNGKSSMSLLRKHLRVTLALLVLGITGFSIATNTASAHEFASETVRAAELFLKSLDPKQQESVRIEFDNGQRRTSWHYLPSSMMESRGGRRGLAMKDMSPEQRTLAHGLLSSVLSHKGYLQAMTVMTLESILHELENKNPSRDPEMYHVAVYGQPSTKETWGWSFEGHHLSVNITLVKGHHISVTPSFFGSNPAVVHDGPFEGLEVLQAEQQIARKLARSLTAEQKKMAVLPGKVPRDVTTQAEPEVDRGGFQPPQGIPLAELKPEQQRMLLELIAHFAQKYRQPILDQIDKRSPIFVSEEIHFAWSGGLESGMGHYYRIQTPHFLFEYDNTQNKANHVHAVWRQFDGDFGADLLRQHYETSPHHKTE
jgi:hypothetical protein